MNNQNNNTCATCKWFESLGNNEGRCHRYPPKIVGEVAAITDTQNTSAFFPVVNGHYWCGEHSDEAHGFAMNPPINSTVTITIESQRMSQSI